MSAAPGTTCPADGRLLPPVAGTAPLAVPAVVGRARAAQPGWAALPLADRADRLLRVARRIVEKRAEILSILSDELGRAPSDSLLSEVATTISYVQGVVAIGKDVLKPEPVKLSMIDFPGKRATVELVPRGVIGIIEPWNYPVLQFYKPVFPALLAGNTVVLKPSEHSPRSGIWLAEQFQSVLPADVVLSVVGAGDVGAALVEADVDAVVFCGSVATGRKVAMRCAERMIPCSIELGGKDAAIVLADCDFERTVAGITHWSLHNAGQDCSSIERVIVMSPIADRFVKALGRAVSLLRVSPPEGEGDLPPLQNQAQLEIVESQVAEAVKDGAIVVCGGKRTGRGLGYEPTVLDHCTPSMRIIREETFGPVIAILRVESLDEAVKLANDSVYGLNGSVWTSDLGQGEALARRLHVGVAYVNNHSFAGVIPQIPWTGTRSTGTGVAASRHAYGTFTRPRTVVVDKNAKPDVFWMPSNPDLLALGHAVSELQLGSLSQILTLFPLLGKRVEAIRKLARGER